MTDFQLTNPENPDLCKPELSQFYTPPELAERIAAWAIAPFEVEYKNGEPRTLEVLEPSCGRGALVAPLVAMGCDVHGYDIDPDNAMHCNQAFPGTFITTNFLTRLPFTVGGQYDLALMNPPFEGGATEAHVLHALKFARRVVCHCPLTTLEGVDRKARLWDHVSLTRMVIHSRRPKYSGARTGGETAMCTIEVVPQLQDGVQTQIEWWA